MYGGGQENGLRSGTEAVPSIAGFGEAARIAGKLQKESAEQMMALKVYCMERFDAMDGVIVNSPCDEKLGAPHILNISVPGIRSEVMLHYLASKGVYVSSGSACSRGAKSPVLDAMGLSDARIDSALRISFCRYNTKEDADELINGIAAGMSTLERSTPHA